MTARAVKAIRCDRCQRRCPNPRADNGWNVVMAGGYAVGFLCTLCQTPEETTEAEINAATTIYSANNSGQILGRPKIEEDPD